MGYGFFVFAAPKFVFLYFVTTQHNMDGSPFTWFVGKDVARRLGYKNTAKALPDHVDEEDKLTERIVLSGQASYLYQRERTHA